MKNFQFMFRVPLSNGFPSRFGCCCRLWVELQTFQNTLLLMLTRLKQNFSKQFLRILTSQLFILFLFNIFSNAQTQPINLDLNKQSEYEIKGGETHLFSVILTENQTARVELVQNGVDVSLSAENPSGEIFIETETPSGFFGDDLILVTAVETGVYKILVTPANPRAASGKYIILLKEIRQSVPEDFAINEAARKLTKLAEETNIARAKGTIEGRREALAKWREVVELSKIKKDRVWEGIALISSGLIYEQLGEIQNALEVYLQSLNIWQEIGNRQYEGSAINNIGIIYNDVGEFDKAVANYQQAIKIQREIGNRQSEGISLNNLAFAYMRSENYVEAEKFYKQSLEIKREDESPRGQRSVAVTLNNLGRTFSLKGETEKGIELLQQALDLRRKIDDRWGVANSLLNLGRVRIDVGKKDDGFTNIEEANLRAKTLGDRRMEAESLYLLAVSEENRGNLEKAIENVRNGLEIVEQIRGELVGSTVRYAYFSTVQNFYELYIDLLVSGFQKTKNKTFITKALEISERSRSRSLIELLQEAKVNFRQGIDENSLEKLRNLQHELNNKYNFRQRLLSEEAKPAETEKIADEINDLNIKIQLLNIEIRRKNPRFSDLTEGKTISADEFQNLIDDETVLLEYKLGERRSFLWIVTNKSIELNILPPRREIEEKAGKFYNLIVENKRAEQENRLSAAADLSRILLSPAASRISGKRIAVVGESILQYLPFSALPIPGSQTKFLADENEIVVLPSASVLAQLRENSVESKLNNKTIAIFADPVFDINDSRIIKNKNPQTSDNQTVIRDSAFAENLPRLLASRQEAKNISNFSNSDKTIIKTDFDASVSNITNENLADYRILHFATHGILNTSRPAFSGLYFSLFDRNGQPQKGFLTLEDIYNLELSSDLIVLSACQTALGKDIRGEGLIGLSRAFLYAGSHRVVASLWKVDDVATAEFMRLFYRNHLEKNLPASTALQQAKIEMKKIPRYRSPFYWSAFTLLGDWK